MMKNLFVIFVVQILFLGSQTHAQDTLAIEPASILNWNRVSFINNNRLVSIEYFDEYYDICHYINIYDITDANHPELIENLSGIWFQLRNERGGVHGRITGAYLLEDVLFWITCKETHWIHLDDSFGPISLCGYQFGVENGWQWNRELLEQIPFEHSCVYSGNMALDEENLVVAGGQAGINIFDVSDLENPNLISTIDQHEQSVAIIEDRLLILLTDIQGIHLYDLSDPEQPQDMGSYGLDNNEYPYNFQTVHVFYNNCLVFRSNFRRDPHSSLLLLDVLSDEDPRDGEIIDLGREYGVFRFYIENDRLYIHPSDEDYIDVYYIDDDLQIEYIATLSLSNISGPQFIVHDNKLIFSGGMRTIIYAIPPELKVNESELTPDEFSISVFPNPFNASTKIIYTLEVPSPVKLSVYNTRSQLVDVLVDRVMPAGRHSVAWKANQNPAGIYFVDLKSAGKTAVEKILLMR